MKTALMTLLIGASVFVFGRWGLGRLPSEKSLVNIRAKAPEQTPIAPGSIEAREFPLTFNKKLYTVYPKARYRIEGLIVSQHRSDSLFDLAHSRSGDFLNSRDVCTVWGTMLAAGIYRDVSFWSGDWTCNYQYSNFETAAVFRADEVSNTHLLATDAAVRQQLASLETGDEYRMSGRLVDYEIYNGGRNGGRRNSSIVRNDTGNGACEVLLVDSVEILKSHNKLFHTMSVTGYWMSLISIFAILLLMLRAIFFRHAVFILFAFSFASAPFIATAKLCDASTEYCGDWGGSSSSSTSSTSRGTKIRLNPATIPIAKGLGIEMIYYDSSVDVALVKGLGRVGAAISPSNSEETFFGPPGFEDSAELQLRKEGRHKFPAQKYTLATAVGLFDNKKSGFNRLSMNLGVMAKYNKFTEAFTPGGGLSAQAGPFAFAYSRYADQTLINTSDAFSTTFFYNIETFSISAHIASLAVDYSNLKVIPEGETGGDDATVEVITVTWLLRRAILTAAQRTEKIPRPTYNFDTGALELVDQKTEYFGGLQVAVFKPLLIGVFYNYYLQRDISIGATFFF